MSRITITFENAETFNEFLLQNKSSSSDPTLDDKLKNLQKEYNSLMNENRELEKKRIQLTNDCFEYYQKLESLHSEIEDIRSDNHYLEEKIKDLEEKLELEPYKML